LIVVGSKGNGTYNMAPKHLAMPLGWDNYFCFVCTPAHHTYQNIKRTRQFTISVIKPDQIVLASLTASPYHDKQVDGETLIDKIPTIKAKEIDALFMKDSYVFLECTLDRIIDDYGKNSLIIGKVIQAYVDENVLIHEDSENENTIQNHRLLVYVTPGRFASVENTIAFPFPKDFSK